MTRKYAALALCLLIAVASVHYSDAGLVTSIVEKIDDVRKTVDNVIISGLQLIQNQLASANNLVDEILDSVKKSGHAILQDVETKASDIVAKVDSIIDNITSSLEAEDKSECKKLAKIVASTIDEMVSNATVCVSNKVNQASNIAKQIVEITGNATEELKELGKKALKCNKGIGIEAGVDTLLCIGDRLKEASQVTGEQINSTAQEVSKLVKLAVTLLPSLNTCALTIDMTVLLEQADNAVAGVKACVNEQISSGAVDVSATTLS